MKRENFFLGIHNCVSCVVSLFRKNEIVGCPIGPSILFQGVARCSNLYDNVFVLSFRRIVFKVHLDTTLLFKKRVPSFIVEIIWRSSCSI